jgi:hypothetical protein
MATFKRPSEYRTGSPAEPQTSSAWAEFLRSLEAKLATTKGNLGQLESERAEQSLAAELGDQNALGRLAAIRSELEAGERALEAVELAKERVRRRLKEAESREADEREAARQKRIAEMKAELMKCAGEFDAAAIQMKKALDGFYRLTSDIFNLMTAEEQQNFLGARSSAGPRNAAGFHGIARPLEMDIAARSSHHMALADYVHRWCEPPRAAVTPASPPREKITVEFKTEAEALSQPRPR